MSADLARYRVTWTGWPGGPGVSTFYGDSQQLGVNSLLNTFFQAVKAYIPTGITITVPGQGDLINDADGSLTGQFTDSTDKVITGTGTGHAAAAAGAMFTWTTDALHNGRHLRGKTFLVPFISDSFGIDGLILPNTVTILQSAGDALAKATNHNLKVWGRPRYLRVKGQPPVFQGPGTSAPMTGCIVKPKTAVLRSRRD